MKYTIYSIVIASVAAVSLCAQESSPLSFKVGAGFTNGIGRTGDNLDTGWNTSAGVGFNFSPVVGAMVNLNYSSLGINSSTLSNIGVPGGNTTVFSATLDPVVHLTPHSHVDIYVSGGGGLYHRYQEFSTPTVATVYGYNPFFGLYPTVVPVNRILASYSENKPGFDAGIGIAFGSKWHGKFYGEARYNRMFTSQYYHMDYLPVTFGYRR